MSEMEDPQQATKKEIKQKINGRRLVGTTLLKGDQRRHVLLRGGETSYLTDKTWGRHVLVVCVKWQNGTD
jgi:hypothetical protein